jgi:hypothetical protein
VYVSPGQRADKYVPSPTTNAGRESVAVSRANPDVFVRQSGLPGTTSQKSAGLANARVTSDYTDM